MTARATPNSFATRRARSASESTTAATSTRGSRCQPGMWARSAQRPAPTTAPRSSLLLILVDSSSRRWRPGKLAAVNDAADSGARQVQGRVGGGGGGGGGGRSAGRVRASGSMAAQSDPRVDDRVEDVDDEVHDHHED